MNNEVKVAWNTPALASLDVNRTLGGIVITENEAFFATVDLSAFGLGNVNVQGLKPVSMGPS